MKAAPMKRRWSNGSERQKCGHDGHWVPTPKLYQGGQDGQQSSVSATVTAATLLDSSCWKIAGTIQPTWWK
ncbi:MAG: hypothetical protein ACYDCX_06655 [Acidithiobacillus sp.]